MLRFFPEKIDSFVFIWVGSPDHPDTKAKFIGPSFFENAGIQIRQRRNRPEKQLLVDAERNWTTLLFLHTYTATELVSMIVFWKVIALSSERLKALYVDRTFITKLTALFDDHEWRPFNEATGEVRVMDTNARPHPSDLTRFYEVLIAQK